MQITYLDSVNVNAFIRFYDEAMAFESETGRKADMKRLISGRVRAFLVEEGRHFYRGLDLCSFDSLDLKSVKKLMRIAVEPLSLSECVNTLRATISFPRLPKDYILSDDNFEDFYYMLLEYVDHFKSVLKFISPSSGVCASFLSPFHEELLDVFVDKIPYDYGYDCSYGCT
jgi:hypothetical protein